MNEAAVAAFRAALTSPESKFITDVARLKSDFSADRSFHPPHPPHAAAIPATIEEVAALVRAAQAHRIPVTVRGSGTGLEGHCVPYCGGLVIDTRLFRRFEPVPADSMCWVGAGVLKMEFNKMLSKHGLLFGPDPASNPSLGGMCSTGGSGMSTLKYGTTRENLVSLRVVTAEGDIVQTRQPVRKSATGLDLTQLYCGSEGTLGVVCELLVRVHPIPQARCGGLVAFATTGAAVRAVVDVRTKHRIDTIVRLEFVNEEGIRATNAIFAAQLPEAPTLLIELQGSDPVAMRRDFDGIMAVCAAHGADAGSARFCADGAELDGVWEARRGCYPAAFRYRGTKGDRVYMTDVCVPLGALAQSVEDAEADFRGAGFPCMICAHIADGNFHAMIPFRDETERARLFECEERMCTRAIAAGGTVSGEHGIGIGKLKHLRREHGAAHLAVQRRIKDALDPNGLFNPGKFYARL